MWIILTTKARNEQPFVVTHEWSVQFGEVELSMQTKCSEKILNLSIFCFYFYLNIFEFEIRTTRWTKNN